MTINVFVTNLFLTVGLGFFLCFVWFWSMGPVNKVFYLKTISIDWTINISYTFILTIHSQPFLHQRGKGRGRQQLDKIRETERFRTFLPLAWFPFSDFLKPPATYALLFGQMQDGARMGHFLNLQPPPSAPNRLGGEITVVVKVTQPEVDWV